MFKIRFIRSVFFSAAWLLMLCGASVVSAQDGDGNLQVLMLDFEDAATSDHYRSMHLAERFRTIAANAVPSSKNSWRVQIELADADAVQKFAARVSTRQKELKVTIPLKYDLWRNDTHSHEWLMSLLILAQLGDPLRGLDPGFENSLRSHWIVRGLARKAGTDLRFVNRPFARTFPMAYALCSNGITPTVKQTLSTTAFFRKSALSMLEAEYAELFLDLCKTKKFYRSRTAETILRAALVAPDADPYTAFLNASADLNIPRDVDTWFREYLEKTLITYFSPYSPEYFETKYRDVTTVKFMDKDGFPQQYSLSDLPAHRKSFEDWNQLLDRLLSELNILAFRAPSGFQVDLSRIRIALSGCRIDQTGKAAQALKNAERDLYKNLAKTIEREQILRQAEQKFMPHALRMKATFGTASTYHEESLEITPAIQEKLNRWDDYK